MTRYIVGSRGKCLHCHTTVRFEDAQSSSGTANILGLNQIPFFRIHSTKYPLLISYGQCPECFRKIITVFELEDTENNAINIEAEHVVWPFSSSRPPVSLDVPETIAQDYTEASVVLPFSPKASAALSRRCLQTVLVEAGKVTPSKNLSQQIDEVLPNLPTYIAKNVDAIRNVGNFAAHEQKSITSGAILDVEPGEAEWNLDVLDALFDFYYVRPEIEIKKREELNIKLKEAGKPPLKQLEEVQKEKEEVD